MGLLLLLLLTSKFATALSPTLPVVDLGSTVHQATLNSSGPYPYFNFSNIRYGAAPVGNLRFAAPVAPQNRNSTINNGQQGVICPQAEPAWFSIQKEFLSRVNVSILAKQYHTINTSEVPAPDPRTSEDCLFLDVIVPVSIYNSTYAQQNRGETCDCKCNPTGAPVLVWIHGGLFVLGDKASSGNPATLLARSQANNSTGVIFIAMNYRLGMFGWLAGPTFFAEGGTPNAGLLDQRLALQWIRDHIALFGGDPDNVTVMGESAGGGSIMHHITAYGGTPPPTQRAHFQRAILQSPAYIPVPDFRQQDLIYSQALGNASAIIKQTHNISAAITTLAQLRSLDFKTLYLVNAVQVANAAYGIAPFTPAPDGSYVPALPSLLLSRGQYNKAVSLLVGHTSAEGLLFASPFVRSQSDFVASVTDKFPFASPEAVAELSAVLYPAVFDGSYGYTSQVGREAALVGDFHIVCNAVALDEAFATLPRQRKLYGYLFAIGQGLHGDDVPYTFYNGDDGMLDGGVVVNGTDAGIWQDYLLGFVRAGDPNAGVSRSGLGGRGSAVEWPLYSDGKGRGWCWTLMLLLERRSRICFLRRDVPFGTVGRLLEEVANQFHEYYFLVAVWLFVDLFMYFVGDMIEFRFSLYFIITFALFLASNIDLALMA